VLLAENGREGLEHYCRTHPDVISYRSLRDLLDLKSDTAQTARLIKAECLDLGEQATKPLGFIPIPSEYPPRRHLRRSGPTSAFPRRGNFSMRFS
jgi:hypothetical protein